MGFPQVEDPWPVPAVKTEGKRSEREEKLAPAV